MVNVLVNRHGDLSSILDEAVCILNIPYNLGKGMHLVPVMVK